MAKRRPKSNPYDASGRPETDPPTRHRPPPPPLPEKYKPEIVELQDQFYADPFNPVYRYPSDFKDKDRAGKQTPLGVLVEVQGWLHRYAKDIARDGTERSQRAWSVLKDGINETLTREIKEKRR